MTIEYKDSKRIVANEADVAVISNRGTIDFTGGLGNTDADDVAHFESTGQLNKIIGEKIESGNSLIGQTVTKLQFKLFRMDSGTISDTLTFGVWDFATGDLKTNGSFGTVRIDELVYNASSSHSNAQKVTLVHSGSGVTIATNDIIGIRSNVDTMTSKRVEVAQHDDATPDTYANGARCIFVEGANSPASTSGKDIWFQAGTSSGNTIITFNSDGTFTPTSAFDVEWLVMAGGGAGGFSVGGGGGAGGYRTGTGHGVTAKNYAITVGAGGARTTTNGTVGANGSDSVFDIITSTGGGGGGCADAASAGHGGSGGGGAGYAYTTKGNGNTPSITPITGETTTVQGYDGGTGVASTTTGCGGGGGSSAVGGSGSGGASGNGGAGTASSITGSSITRAGGGGSSHWNGSAGSGGSGGGTNGARGGSSGTANAGDNTGSGGGGFTEVGGTPSNGAGAGGSGVVIIKFATSGNTFDSTSEGGKPTDVQDNTILVEKDTARRYWRTPESTSSPTTHSQSTDGDVSGIDCVGSNPRGGWGQQVKTGHPLVGKSLKTLTVSTRFSSNIANRTDRDMTVKVFAGLNSATIRGTSDAINTSTLTTAGTFYDTTFTFATPVPISADDCILVCIDGVTGTLGGWNAEIKSSPENTNQGYWVTFNSANYPPANAVQTNRSMTYTATYVTVTPATWTRKLPTLPTISDLVLHLDANASSTITKDSSNLVATWGDGSSASNDITASGSARPTWIDDTQTGLPVIRFDGSNNVMTGTTPSYSLPNTLFMVCTTPNADSEAMFDGDTSRNLFNRQGTNTYRIYAGAGVTGGTANTAMQVFTVVFNNGSPALNINGSAQSLSGTNIGTSALDDIVLGAFDGGSGKADYDVCEVLFYNKALSTSEISSVESYLNKKWGVY